MSPTTVENDAYSRRPSHQGPPPTRPPARLSAGDPCQPEGPPRVSPLPGSPGSHAPRLHHRRAARADAVDPPVDPEHAAGDLRREMPREGSLLGKGRVRLVRHRSTDFSAVSLWRTAQRRHDLPGRDSFAPVRILAPSWSTRSHRAATSPRRRGRASWVGLEDVIPPCAWRAAWSLQTLAIQVALPFSIVMVLSRLSTARQGR